MDFKKVFFSVKDFTLTEIKLGEGAFGKVYIAKKNGDEETKYAAKIIKINEEDDHDEQILIMRESTVLSDINHPAVVQFIGINFRHLDNNMIFQPIMITEYEPNNLRDILDIENNGFAPGEWTPTKKFICLLGISHAMKYLHANNIIHRDLKPENILLNIDFFPKVCDFGLARFIPDSLTKSKNLMTQGIGTPLYMAPELINDDDYGKEVDVYAFGILAYEIITGKQPYSDITNVYNLMARIINGERPKKEKCISGKMFELIERCWNQDPKERPTFSEVFDILKSDISLFKETVNPDEVNDYLNILSSWEKNNQNCGQKDKLEELTEKNTELENNLKNAENTILLFAEKESENEERINDLEQRNIELEERLRLCEEKLKEAEKKSDERERKQEILYYFNEILKK